MKSGSVCNVALSWIASAARRSIRIAAHDRAEPDAASLQTHLADKHLIGDNCLFRKFRRLSVKRVDVVIVNITQNPRDPAYNHAMRLGWIANGGGWQASARNGTPQRHAIHIAGIMPG